MWTLKYDINETIYETNRFTDIENSLVVAKEKRRLQSDGLGIWD